MKKTLLALSLVAVAASTSFASANDTANVLTRVENATKVVEKLAGPSAAPDLAIPNKLLQKAKCVVVIPDYRRAGFVFGGTYGAGVALCRDSSGDLSNPLFVNMIGGSWGAQIGVQFTDMVLLMLNEDAPQQLLKDGGFKIGGDASAAAGPIGRDAAADTNTNFQDETLEYASAKGIYAGISLNGAKISHEPHAQAEAQASPQIAQAVQALEAELKSVAN